MPVYRIKAARHDADFASQKRRCPIRVTGLHEMQTNEFTTAATLTPRLRLMIAAYVRHKHSQYHVPGSRVGMPLASVGTLTSAVI
ncbi:hypothetical protein C8034_v002959 [Colletotrichum sidae]|uniref:Uncharacterized protein n=2 Tax=Colletotrichum orbiculare species complex TaxID=2707354 RepID=A0A4R8QFT2_9PEZI|nr:hypothetical protein C8034_v002959 [Colletotrichum sidae]TDZ37697.1 hypothetical protein C8035_v007669 [Colletotrichum spinosum]